MLPRTSFSHFTGSSFPFPYPSDACHAGFLHPDPDDYPRCSTGALRAWPAISLVQPGASQNDSEPRWRTKCCKCLESMCWPLAQKQAARCTLSWPQNCAHLLYGVIFSLDFQELLSLAGRQQNTVSLIVFTSPAFFPVHHLWGLWSFKFVWDNFFFQFGTL